MQKNILTVLFVIALMLFTIQLLALDLQFQGSIQINPASIDVDDEVTVTVNFLSVSGRAAGFRVIGGIDSAQLVERNYDSIPADTIRTVTFTWTATSGSHTVWFEIDPDHSTGDTNYGNNRIETTISIGSTSTEAKGDIKFFGGISWSPTGDIYVGNEINVKAKIRIPRTISSVRIKGGVGNGSSTILNRIIERGIGTFKTVSFDWTPSGVGTERLWFRIEPVDPEDDSNPDNNLIEKTVTVKDYPDLTITDFKMTPDPHNRDKFFYSIKFKNAGRGCVSAFHWILVARNKARPIKEGRYAAGHPLCALNPGEEKTHLGFFMRSDFGNEGIRIENTPTCTMLGKVKRVSYLAVEVDDDHKVTESNDSNNRTVFIKITWNHDRCENR